MVDETGEDRPDLAQVQEEEATTDLERADLDLMMTTRREEIKTTEGLEAKTQKEKVVMVATETEMLAEAQKSKR